MARPNVKILLPGFLTSLFIYSLLNIRYSQASTIGHAAPSQPGPVIAVGKFLRAGDLEMRREAVGWDQVKALVMERDMEGFDGWTFPYEWLVIDGDKIMTKWHMVPPFKREDGSEYKILGMSAIRLDNDLKIVEMEDSMDIAWFFAMVDEMRAAGHDVLLPTAPNM